MGVNSNPFFQQENSLDEINVELYLMAWYTVDIIVRDKQELLEDN